MEGDGRFSHLVSQHRAACKGGYAKKPSRGATSSGGCRRLARATLIIWREPVRTPHQRAYDALREAQVEPIVVPCCGGPCVCRPIVCQAADDERDPWTVELALKLGWR